MDYTALYQSKLTTADEAVKAVESGHWVDYGWCVGTPDVIDQAMAKRLPELTDVNFRGGVLMRVPEIYKIEDPAAHMTWNSWHMSGVERKFIATGAGFYAPMRYSELPRFYRESMWTLHSCRLRRWTAMASSALARRHRTCAQSAT